MINIRLLISKIFNIVEFIISTILSGIFAMLFAMFIVIAFSLCMTIWIILPCYLTIGCEYWIIGIIYTTFVWGIAWNIVS